MNPTTTKNEAITPLDKVDYSEYNNDNVSTPRMERSIFEGTSNHGYDEMDEDSNGNSFRQSIEDIQKAVYITIHEIGEGVITVKEGDMLPPEDTSMVPPPTPTTED
jgi:hypothetical protein